MTSQFDATVELLRHSNASDVTQDMITGSIRVDSDVQAWIRVLDEVGAITELIVNGRSVSPESIQLNADASYEVRIPYGEAQGGYFVESLDVLLARSEHCYSVPGRIYIHDINILVPGEKHDLIDRYRMVARFVSTLRDMADFKLHDEIAFVSTSRLDLSILYTQQDLEHVHVGSIDKLIAELHADKPDHHSERRQEIFIRTLTEMLGSISKDQRLGHAIAHLDEIYRIYRRDYDLYAKKFSYTSMMAEFDEQKSEHMKKLNAAVQDISAKLLSIPLAYVLIAGQLEENGGMKNHIIAIGSIIFAMLMIMMVGGQLLTLRHIRQDIASFKDSYKDRINAVGLGAQFKQLTSKRRVQSGILWVVLVIVVAITIMALYLYGEYTSPDLYSIALSKINSILNVE